MLVCVFTTQLSAFAMPEKHVVQKDGDSSQAVFSQLSQETVVPNYAFSFGDFHVFCPEKPLEYVFFQEESEPLQKLDSPENTYLTKIFEHLIATNAP